MVEPPMPGITIALDVTFYAFARFDFEIGLYIVHRLRTHCVTAITA